jgi:predicted nucleotidyltransferase
MAGEQNTTLRAPSADDPILETVVQRLVDAYRPERIYLFGSVARGDANPDSDYDLMVVVPDAAPERLRSEDPGYRVLRGAGIGADILVWTRTDFDRQLHLKASLPSTVIREGRALYLAA